MGAAGYNAETLEIELNWIDEHIDGMPYGVELLTHKRSQMRTTRWRNSRYGPGRPRDSPLDSPHNTTLIQPMFTTNKPDRLGFLTKAKPRTLSTWRFHTRLN